MEVPGSTPRIGEVRAIVVGGGDGDARGEHDFVLWRGADGRLRGVPRSCPHLDHDLAEGYVVDDELVCPGHGWAFDGDGNAYKRNEFGRVDPKGTVATLEIHEGNDTAEIALHP